MIRGGNMNKRIKIILISALVSVLMISALVIAYANTGDVSTEKKTIYEYALIGET